MTAKRRVKLADEDVLRRVLAVFSNGFGYIRGRKDWIVKVAAWVN